MNLSSVPSALENSGGHVAQIFIELFHDRFGIRAFGHARKPYDVRK